MFAKGHLLVKFFIPSRRKIQPEAALTYVRAWESLKTKSQYRSLPHNTEMYCSV